MAFAAICLQADVWTDLLSAVGNPPKARQTASNDCVIAPQMKQRSPPQLTKSAGSFLARVHIAPA